MGNLIIPGSHGVGTIGIVPTSDGYDRAADALVKLHDERCHIDIYDSDVQRVMNYYHVSSIDELKIKRRGW